ncbi:MAG: CBS domain-containing protein [Beijerinckiaceae bacterium]|nr:CBS domain-containing protein [Beijerinckiaceae bacterium]
MAQQMDADDQSALSELEQIKQDVVDGKEPTRSVRELLRWFGAYRRRAGVVERVNAELEAVGLRTDPHFTTVWVDAPVTFRLIEEAAPFDAAAPLPVTDAPSDPPADRGIIDALPDTAHLVRMLEAANRKVISVNPQDPIETAITLMLAHDYSQLAVMTGPRELKGAISWKSIGSRLSQRNELKQVLDAMEVAAEVRDSDSLFEATKTIIQQDYVFVRANDRTITGIVTATDLSEQFQGLSEPFLLLGRIENQIRRMIQNAFDVGTLRDACDERDPDRKATLTQVSQLTFGEYQHILEKEANWAKFGFVACRKTFCKELDEVRKLRNEIMHFHPDVIEGRDFEQLRRFSRLLEQLEKLSK